MKILLVEDDPAIRPALKTILSINGHEVVEVDCGQKALEHLEDERDFNFVITDLDLGSVTGFEVLEAARDHVPNARRILMSGRMGNDLVPQAEAAGAQDTFVKTEFMEAFDKNGLLRKAA